VDRVALCDREADRVRKFLDDAWYADKCSEADAFTSLDGICAADLDALAVFTQPWLHAPQCIQAMESGKNVYSAVPIISVPDGNEILDWCDKLVETVTRTGRHYMLGETTFYHPESMFCRRKAAAGEFGDFVYAEGEYVHDVDSWCNLRDVMKHRLASAAGQEWIGLHKSYTERGIKGGPMHYPTHSVSGPVSVMGTHALEVTAYGYRNRNDDPYFAGSEFSDEIALFKMANGATVRICEMRESGGPFHESETFRVMGTRGTYSERCWKDNGRTNPANGRIPGITTMTDEEMRDPLPEAVAAAFAEAAEATKCTYGGHGGSHPYLVSEFVDAIATGRTPAINVHEAVRYMAMGVMAHESALRDGETLKVPDWGDAPVVSGIEVVAEEEK
jgi:predicted dehydrogenase